MCASGVQWLLRHDRRGTLRFAALDSVYGADVRRRHPEIAGIDSMIWVEPATPDEPEHISVQSNAALRIARYLGGVWRLALVGGAVPKPLRDAAYNVIARYRHHLRGRRETCPVPGPDVRARFLE
jgi:predicted DCC family thiol-disulfide oxidoreductase YuxK